MRRRTPFRPRCLRCLRKPLPQPCRPGRHRRCRESPDSSCATSLHGWCRISSGWGRSQVSLRIPQRPISGSATTVWVASSNEQRRFAIQGTEQCSVAMTEPGFSRSTPETHPDGSFSSTNHPGGVPSRIAPTLTRHTVGLVLHWSQRNHLRVTQVNAPLILPIHSRTFQDLHRRT
jgi:hypothetical protein